MKTVTPRTWQQEFHNDLSTSTQDTYMLVACPAAGKTIAAGVAAAQLMTDRGLDQVIVVAPTVVVRDQWAKTLTGLGYSIAPQIPDRGVLPPWHHGVCVTYAQAAYRAEQVSALCEDRATVAICDEIHHASEQQTWGEGLRKGLENAAFRLLLSGTPFRSDGRPLPFVNYNEQGDCVADFAYQYSRAVAERVCRPIEFKIHDGQITWSTTASEPRQAQFSDTLPEKDATHRLRAALDPAQPYLQAVLQRAHTDLKEMREEVPDAAGLVICDSQKHALHVDRILNQIAGSVPTLAISDIPRSHKALAAFASETDPWLVSVRMVSEGVDIPRLAVVVWLTGASTELMVRQVVGRAIRGRKSDPDLPAIVHMPADPRLTRHAERLEMLAGVSLKSPRTTSVTTNHETQPDRGKVVSLAAKPVAGNPARIVPSLDFDDRPSRSTPNPVEIELPDLPPSPEQIKQKEQIREQRQAGIYRLLQVYTELRRDDDPAFQMAAAHQELAAAVGSGSLETGDDEHLADALAWINEKTARLALAKPGLVKAMARRRRRNQLAIEAA